MTLLLALLFTLPVGGEPKSKSDVTQPKIRDEILARAKKEQDLRFKLIKDGGFKPTLEERTELMAVDTDNRTWLKGIIEKYGWPGKTLVGVEGAHMAWLMIQHADAELSFQKKCLELLKEAVKQGEATGVDLAYLTDRVLSAEGKKQLYGTQLEFKDGKLTPKAVEDEASLDARRKQLGMQSIDEYVKTASKMYKVKETKETFRWEEKPGESLDLYFADRLVVRYMNAAHDSSTKAKHEMTFKVFHHVYDPKDGKTLLTNGAGLTTDKTQLYPHHRGLFFGFNKISVDNQQADVWHGHSGEFEAHEKDLGKSASAEKAWHAVQIGWHGKDGKKFAEERRDLTVYNEPGGTLIDFASVLKTDVAKVHLDGDPQHAGFHFRACQEVNANKGETYYVRPDGVGKKGDTRNWDPKTKKGPVNLPWDAMSFVVAGKRYTVLYMDHPNNPKEARGSERDYGRFGNYFEYDLTPTTPLKVHYRVWVQSGEMTVAQCESMSREFVKSPEVK